MKQFKLLVILMLMTLAGFAQAPSNYTNINGRYRWIAGMFDSTFHIPKGTTPSLRTGGSTNAGALFYKTADSSLQVYTGTQWLRMLKVGDTTGMLTPYFNSVGVGLKSIGQQVYADTLLLSTRLWRQKGVDSLQANINQKLNISDTASMLSPYLRSNVAAATYVPQTRTLSINGTSYDLSANRSWSVGTVTSVATNTGTGITGGTITSSGTIAADTLLLSTRAWRQKGIDSVAALVSGAVSGTTNYIPKFTSSSAIGNSVIYEASGSIGIGTISPNTYGKFALANSGTVEGYSVNTSTTGQASWWSQNNVNNKIGIFQYGSAQSAYGAIGSSEGALYSNNSLTIMADAASSAIKFAVNGNTEQMRLTSTGLGIGTSSPASKLDVSSSAADVMRLRGTNGGTTNNTQLRFYGSNAATDLWAIGTEVSTGTTGRAFDFYDLVANANRMRLDASGNLGLGVTPSAGNTTTNLQIKNIQLSALNEYLYLTTNGNYNSGWKYLATDLAAQYRQVSGEHIWYTAPSGTAGNAISFTQAMTLDASGNLLVGGTSSNGLRLQVTGDIYASNEMYLDNGKYLRLQRSSGGLSIQTLGIPSGTDNVRLLTTGDFDIVNGSLTNLVKVTNTGSVGIGTTSPYNKLEIVGLAGNYSTSPSVVFTDNAGAANSNRWIIGNIATDYGSFNIASAPTPSSTTWTPRFTITKDGSVGIGTTSPNALLDAYTSQGGTTIAASHGTGGSYPKVSGISFGATSTSLSVSNNGGTTTFIGGAGIYANNTASSNNPTELIFWTTAAGSPTERMRITSGGNVLIKKTNDTGGPLQVSDGSNMVNFSWNVNDAVLSSVNNANTIYRRLAFDANDYTFSTSATERMRITSGGELLINTTSDAGDYKLQVNGTIYGTSNIMTTGSTAEFLINGAGSSNTVGGSGRFTIFDTSNNRGWIIQQDASYDLQFWHNNSGWSQNIKFTNGGAIKTAAPSGGTAKPYKWGEAGVAIGGSDGYAVKVEIDGTLYYLMTGYLPEPEPLATPGESGPSNFYPSNFEQPVIKIKSDNQKIKDLEKEIAELKELIKSKIK
jgi:uncharacterized protein YaiE (UPF0345 family)